MVHGNSDKAVTMMRSARPPTESKVLGEPVAGAAPHFFGEDVAGAGFDVVAEVLGRAGALVRLGDGLDAFADLGDAGMGLPPSVSPKFRCRARGAIKLAMSGVSPYFNQPGMKFGKQCRIPVRWIAA